MEMVYPSVFYPRWLLGVPAPPKENGFQNFDRFLQVRTEQTHSFG